jgi:hypothetical protein
VNCKDIRILRRYSMTGQIRPVKKAMKIVYKIMKTPKEKQQGEAKKPSETTLQEWEKDSIRTY